LPSRAAWSNLAVMYLEPFSGLSWAYRLHYDLAFQTHWRRPDFQGRVAAEHLTGSLKGYARAMPITTKVYPDHVRVLISLQPAHILSKVLHAIKTNSSAEMCRRLGIQAPLWARGYLARAVGRISVNAGQSYLTSQPEHHGYGSRTRPPVHRFRAARKTELRAAHASFDLSHHIVFSSEHRKGVFTSDAGEALGQYWLRAANKHGFAIDQMSFLPDHVHLLVRTNPSASIESTCLSLLNNSQYFMGKHFGHLLTQSGVERLWQGSAFAGTCGEMTTALVKWYLSQGA
jgi:putative transposase